MYKLIDKNDGTVICTGLPSTNLDEAIRLAGGTIDTDGEACINGIVSMYDELDLVPEDPEEVTA